MRQQSAASDETSRALVGVIGTARFEWTARCRNVLPPTARLGSSHIAVQRSSIWAGSTSSAIGEAIGGKGVTGRRRLAVAGA